MMKINYEFRDKKLLETALTHSSYAHENSAKEFNERLEFLGDAVLELVISDYLYNNYADETEGDLTRFRAALVCEQSLAPLSREIGLDRELRFGRGEELSGGRNRDSIIADALEALFGAVYLDGGIEAARSFILGVFGDKIAQNHNVVTDYKTYLQEVLQRDSKETAVYAIISESGPDHNKTFTAAVSFNGQTIGTGEGKSKKDAEQKAALLAIKRLQL